MMTQGTENSMLSYSYALLQAPPSKLVKSAFPARSHAGFDRQF